MKNELKSMFTEYWKYLSVNTACELEIFDKIFKGQNSSEKIIISNNWDSRTLMNLIEFLMNESYLNVLENSDYVLTDKGNLLRKDNPEGLYYACLNWSGEHLNAWQNLKYSIVTGKSSFEQIYQKPYFNYLNEHPEKLMNYHKAMFEYAIDDYKELPNIIDFNVHNSIMDVGGGYGAAISLIKEKFLNIRCLLFDLDKVIEHVTNENIETVSGDFFIEIPYNADAIILSRVLHDWDDEKSSLILQNCFKALPQNGTLYVIENCTDKIQTNLSLLSLNMAVMCQSYERNSIEYQNLCEAQGFSFQESKQLNGLQTILIFKK